MARAFGADGIIYSGVVEEGVIETLKKVTERWGGPFYVEKIKSYRHFLEKWRERGIIVHLTMYGENIEESDVLRRILEINKPILVVVGAEKVPWDIYQLADFNVAIGNQPHSEVAALAVFLDRLFRGKELLLKYSNAKVRIIPSPRGKIIRRVENIE